jgi:hypothetical protein
MAAPFYGGFDSVRATANCLSQVSFSAPKDLGTKSFGPATLQEGHKEVGLRFLWGRPPPTHRAHPLPS